MNCGYKQLIPEFEQTHELKINFDHLFINMLIGLISYTNLKYVKNLMNV